MIRWVHAHADGIHATIDGLVIGHCIGAYHLVALPGRDNLEVIKY